MVKERRRKEAPSLRPDGDIRSPARAALALVSGLGAVFVVAVIGTVFYQNLMFAGIKAEPLSLLAPPGQPLRVQGQFLAGCRLSLGADNDYVPVEYTADASSPNRLTITAVPQYLAGRVVYVKAQRAVAGLPLLTPIMPSVVSSATVQVGVGR